MIRSPGFLVAEDRHRSFVKFTEEFSLPAGPGFGTDPLDIGSGEDVEHAEHFLAADVATEADEEGRIGDIPSEGLEGHHEVLEDEEDERLGLALGQLQAESDVGGDACPDLAVVLFESLADVVEENCKMEEGLVVNGTVRLAKRGGIADEAGSFLDTPEGMFVDGVAMVLIELHEAVGVSELGYDFFEESGFVHLPERDGERTGTAED